MTIRKTLLAAAALSLAFGVAPSFAKNKAVILQGAGDNAANVGVTQQTGDSGNESVHIQGSGDNSLNLSVQDQKGCDNAAGTLQITGNNSVNAAGVNQDEGVGPPCP